MPSPSVSPMPETLQACLKQAIHGFFTEDFTGGELSATLYPGLYVGRDTRANYLDNPHLLEDLQQPAHQHNHAIRLAWHEEPRATLKSAGMHIPPRYACESTLLRVAICILPRQLPHY